MIARLPLIRRITIAFVLLTAVISGIFSVSIVAIVHYIEAQLVSEELNNELNNIIREIWNRKQPPKTHYKTRFFASNLPGHEIPQQFSGAEPGFSELINDNEAFHVFRRDIGGDSYVLIQDQQDFEAREHMLFIGVLIGFLMSLILAWMFGRLVARHAIAPVIRLAQQVRHRDQLIAVAPPLASEYSSDEVGNLAAAFDDAIGKLRSALEREHLFTSDVSHELRTPLMVIASSCELLLETPKLTDNERAQIEKIDRACKEMRDLAETFLMLARSDVTATASNASISLAQAAQEQFQQWQESFAAKGLEFSIIERGVDRQTYHATFLKTVISNLLRNALHYTEQGTVELILEKDGFSVHDTGTGVPLDQHERIFQPFIRGHQQRGEGYGLGLSLVRRICQHQGWKVDLQTTATGGSVFQVRLK